MTMTMMASAPPGHGENAGKLAVDLLCKGGDIVTLNKHDPYIRNGALAVAGNAIVAVGPAREVEERVASAHRVVDFSGLAMMPGLVDGHTHLFQNLGKTLGDGMSLLPWLAKFMMPLATAVNQSDAISAARLGALHGLLSGTTALVDNHYAPTDEATIIGVANAIEELGMRGVAARGIYGSMVEGGRRMNCDPRLFQYSVREELDITRACLREKPAGSLVEVWPAPENVVYLDPELLIASHELATELGVRWHTHCSESRFEVEIFESVHGLRPARWLSEQGILDDRATLAHGIWFDAEEIALLGAAGATVAHNPISNQYLASGIIKLGPLMRAGVNVALGSDGVAVAGQDMFEAMKAAQLLQRLRELDPESANAELALCMATRNGGRLLNKNLGVLKEGALADFVMVDLSGPHHQPKTRPVCCLALSARAADVRHVVVNGDIVVENGRSTKADQEKIIADAVQASAALVERAGLRDLIADWVEPALH